MIAFKTYSQLPEEQRPAGVPLDYPAISIHIEANQEGIYSIDHTVLTEQDYQSYVDSKQEAYSLWKAANPDVPIAVTTRQMKKALVIAGKYTSIENFIAALPEPQKTLVTIEWRESNEFQRQNPTLLQMAAAMGMSSSEIDQLFILANTL